jgi:hypothetical protein
MSGFELSPISLVTMDTTLVFLSAAYGRIAKQFVPISPGKKNRGIKFKSRDKRLVDVSTHVKVHFRCIIQITGIVRTLVLIL